MPFNNTFTTYIGNGTTTDYTIPFSRIEDNDIVVLVNGVVTAYTFISASMIRITPAPASGALILIRRETDVDEIKSIFQNGSPIPATQINRNFQQLLYVAQETADLRNVWFRTVGAPASSLGKQGDWAIDEQTGALYQKITDVTWQSVLSLIGPTGSEWFSGSTTPDGSLGELSDFYLQANGDYFEKTGPTTWTLRGSLIGPVGPRGADGGPVPVGGSAGQVLSKVSNTDFNTTWVTPANGNVVGPASSVNNRLAMFSGTTGKLLADSGLTTANFAPASHTHTAAQITDFASAVSSATTGKLNTSGGTMTGLLTLSGDPTTANHAATKSYVDNNPASPFVLLGTLNTTSGAIQTLSGLNLTPYKFLRIDLLNVSHNSATNQALLVGPSLGAVTGIQSSAFLWTGIIDVNLSNGIGNGLWTNGRDAATGLSTASTSVSLSVASGAFDSGSATIYGVR